METSRFAEPDSGNYSDICTFCNELSGAQSPLIDLGLANGPKDYILYENENFVAVPCLGPLTDWYVLVVARRHTLSSGWMSDLERDDLRKTIREVSRLLKSTSGSEVVVFEHGSYDFRNKGGSCQDHAHIHLVATNQDVAELIEIVERHVRLTPVEDWLNAAANAVQQKRSSYLAIETAGGSYLAPATGAPSQFFRRSLCEWLGTDADGWDWLAYPNVERLANMINTRLSAQGT
ncbi:diadenosine tetraphosphate (Ap4A) HIT family hydrolase [Arthrobacter sp. GAS37]|uniref:HIT family protein n=1 Tax=Arthrobacter sp. GAS37 TaxID=3156261 RepID=UPI003833C119